MPATSLDWVSPPRAAESLLSLIEPANDLVSYLIHMLVVHMQMWLGILRYMYICIYNLWLVAVRIMRTQQDVEQINTRSQFTFILKPPALTDDHSFSANKTHTIIKFSNKKNRIQSFREGKQKQCVNSNKTNQRICHEISQRSEYLFFLIYEKIS